MEFVGERYDVLGVAFFDRSNVPVAEDDDFIRRNYEELGGKKVAEILGISTQTVWSRARKLGVCRNRRRRP